MARETPGTSHNSNQIVLARGVNKLPPAPPSAAPGRGNLNQMGGESSLEREVALSCSGKMSRKVKCDKYSLY